MSPVLAAVGFLWPFADASVLEGLAVGFYVALLLSVVPVGWVLLKRRFGLRIAGPLWPLAFFLVLASLYAIATPPWQTPDEPQHMVYSELVRRRGASVAEKIRNGEPITAPERRAAFASYRTVLRSLHDVDIWPEEAQALIESGQIPGPPELAHPPLYYTVSGALTEPLGSSPILARLAVLRAFGIMVAGCVVWLCGVAGRLLWPTRRRLAETPMVVAAGIPTFASFAGTVNSDVLANLWGAALLVVGLLLLLPPRTRRAQLWIAVAILLVVLGVMTKRTVLPVVTVIGLALVLRRQWNLRRFLGVAAAAQVVAALVLLVLPTRTAVWAGSADEHLGCPGARVGKTALCGVEQRVLQFLTVDTIEEVSGRAVSVGFWARATSAPTSVAVLMDTTPTSEVVLPDTEWHFGRVQFVVPPGLHSLPIVLASDGPARVDGVVLTPGRFSEAPPVYERDDGSQVRWDGRRVQNRLANGSAEDEVVASPDWLPRNVQRTVDGAVEAVYALGRGDRVAGAWAFVWERLGLTFGIFWGTMGWDQPPPVLPTAVLWILGLGVVAALVGGVLGLFPPHRLWRVRPALLMLAGVVVMILAVVVRGIPATDVELISGRYLFPGVLAIAVVLAAGWRRLHRGDDDRRFRSLTRWFAVATHIVFVVTVFIPFRWG